MSTISPEEALRALMRSGYPLESRVDAKLRASRFFVSANSVFADPETGKPRELDLHALKGRRAGPDEADLLFTALLIECVNNPEPLVLVTAEVEIPWLNLTHFVMSGIPEKVRDRDDSWIDIAGYLGLDEFHHYCCGRVATQYCSFVRKKGAESEWMATHDDAHFDAFKKLSDAIQSEIDGRWEKFTTTRGEPESVWLTAYYPILVVEGDLAEARLLEDGSIGIFDSDHLQFQHATISGREEVTHQIDVVREGYLPRLVATIDNEMKRASLRLQRRASTVRESVDDIQAQFLRARTEKKRRQALTLY